MHYSASLRRRPRRRDPLAPSPACAEILGSHIRSARLRDGRSLEELAPGAGVDRGRVGGDRTRPAADRLGAGPVAGHGARSWPLLDALSVQALDQGLAEVAVPEARAMLPALAFATHNRISSSPEGR